MIAELTVEYDDAPEARANWAESVDREVASEAICDGCGKVGMGFRSERKPGSYRAWATCECGAQREL